MGRALRVAGVEGWTMAGNTLPKTSFDRLAGDLLLPEAALVEGEQMEGAPGVVGLDERGPAEEEEEHAQPMVVLPRRRGQQIGRERGQWQEAR